MALPKAKYEDQNGVEIELVDYDAMAKYIEDEIKSDMDISHVLRIWGSDFYRQGERGDRNTEALVQPLKRIA